MRQRATILVSILLAMLLFGLSYLGRQRTLGGQRAQPQSPTAVPEQAPTRVVSLAPSITEILFAIDRGDVVAGVTRFCKYPPEAAAKTHVGGFFDPNYEAIAALDPDLVILLEEHAIPREHFREQGLRVVTVDHKTLSGVLDSIVSIARATAVPANGTRLVKQIRDRMAAVAQVTATRPRPRALVTLGRDPTAGKLSRICVAGHGSLYAGLLDLAGAENAYEGQLPYPQVSAEGVLSMNPGVIIEIVGPGEDEATTAATLRTQWQALAAVAAVRNEAIHVFHQDYANVPGPRFVRLLEDMARVLHPTAWEE